METAPSAHIDGDIDIEEQSPVLFPELRPHRNSCLPIFRLPPETLEDIFICGARDYYKSNDYPTLPVPHWINVSYVCRHWRNVALNCPTLWAYYTTVSPRLTEEILARSKQALLKIRINCDHHKAIPWSRLLEMVLNHAERLQELRLAIPGDAIPIELSLNAPRLQVLEVDSWCPSEQTFTIHNADTPSLHTLKLIGCPLPWHSSLNLSRVTTLFLHFSYSLSQPNTMDFLVVLSRMRALVILHLDRALLNAPGLLSSGSFIVSAKVNLPCLARLFVRALLSTVVALLSGMDIPLKTQVRLEIESGDYPSLDDYLQLPLVLAQRFTQLSISRPTIRSFTVRPDMHALAFTISASEDGDYSPCLSMTYPPRDCSALLIIIVEIEWTMGTRSRDYIMSDIFCSIPSSHVEALHVVNPPFSFEFWRKTLGHLDGLQRLKLSKGYMPDLAPFLALAADVPTEDVRGDVTGNQDAPQCHTFVPGLEELELEHISFSSQDSSSGIAVSKEALLGALSTRKALGVRLIMTDCQVMKTSWR